jgi:hypothetical protein
MTNNLLLGIGIGMGVALEAASLILGKSLDKDNQA